MVIDTSALIAIFLAEPDFPLLIDALERDPVRLLSAASLLETSIVLYRRYRHAGEIEIDVFVQRNDIEVVPVTLEQAAIARQAFRRFGKGHHSAGLNFGDCFAYALAKASGEPLLFKGNDFSQTDVPACEWRD